MNANLSYFDMYSKRIGLFFKKKEKIGSLLGFILTIIYIFVSLFLFFLYTSDIIKRKEVNVHDSTVYTSEAPSIELDENLFYFSFGVESPTGTTRFIDPTIYYPKVDFFDKKKVGGNLKTVYQEELKVERCNDTKFGKDYKDLLVEGELSNSYCIDKINFTLKGGFKYDKISYVRIGIYPCVNTSVNNYHCKPQEIIDAHLSGAYFSILAKDIGLDPSNYENPLIPTFQNLYTTIDKTFFRDFIIYYGITDVQTDEGLFNEKITSRKILQFRKDTQAFYFRSEEKYYNGNSMCAIQFRLGDDIRVQKRSYNKMTRVLATTGGYMQLISTVFTIITLLTNKLIYEVKIVNSLFDFYPTKRKISVKTEYTKLIDCFNNNKNRKSVLVKNNIREINNNELSHFRNKTSVLVKNKLNNNSLIQNKESNNLKVNNNSSKILKVNNYDIIDQKKLNNKLSKKQFTKHDESKSVFCSKNEESRINNNRSKIALLPYGLNLVSSNNNLSNSINPRNTSEPRQSNYFTENNSLNKYEAKKMQINLLYYYCFSNCKKEKDDIRLFDSSISFYRRKMDIINIFNILLLIEKMVQE